MFDRKAVAATVALWLAAVLWIGFLSDPGETAGSDPHPMSWMWQQP